MVQSPECFNYTVCLKIIEAELLLIMNEIYDGSSQFILHEDNLGTHLSKYIAIYCSATYGSLYLDLLVGS